jgi:predicted nucleic acid-binding protein
LNRLDLARDVYELFVQLCARVFPVTLADTDRAKEIACSGSKVSIRDAIHASVMLNNGIETIGTFDEGFDRIEGIVRLGM